jgi:hypothetical protein
MHDGTPFELLECQDDSWRIKVTKASAEFAYETHLDLQFQELLPLVRQSI